MIFVYILKKQTQFIPGGGIHNLDKWLHKTLTNIRKKKTKPEFRLHHIFWIITWKYKMVTIYQLRLQINVYNEINVQNYHDDFS